MEPYGETIYGSRGTLVTEKEQTMMLYKEAGGSTGEGGPGQRDESRRVPLRDDPRTKLVDRHGRADGCGERRGLPPPSGPPA